MIGATAKRAVALPVLSPPTPTAIGLPPEANVTIDGINYRASVVDINGTYCTITNRDNQPVSLDGWRLDSPKWAIVDTFRFPSDVVYAAGRQH